MASVEVARNKRNAGQGWLSTVLGIGLLVAVGFALGLVFGVVSEEPELVVGHVAGRSEEIDWTADAAATADVDLAAARAGSRDSSGQGAAALGEPQPLAPSVAAGPPPEPAARPAPKPPERRVDPPEARAPAAASPAVAASSGNSSGGESAPTEPAAVGARFAIQVGAFSDGAAAEQVAADLRAKGYPVRVLRPGQDDRWRVRVGPVSGRAAAEETAGRLKVEEQLPTWVLRERGT